MEYEGLPQRLLASAGAKLGDRIEVALADGRVFEGRLMEHHAFSGKDVVTLKMKSGYNVGVEVGDASRVRVVEAFVARPREHARLATRDGKPRVSILATGGTIASYVDYRTGAVHPVTSPDDLALAVPELIDVAALSTRIVFSMFSEDLQPEHWQKLAHEVKREFDAGARGVVITHGTDTLSYTAAALAFFLKDLPGPVVIVGAQRSSDRPSSDAATNLYSAVKVAAETDIGEVVVVMHGSTADTYCAIHRGTRVRKMHTSRRDAFQSVNARPLGKVELRLSREEPVEGKPASHPGYEHVESAKIALTEAYRKAKRGTIVTVDDALDEEVSLIQTYPGLWPDHFEKVVLRGVVIAGTGLGHIARRNLDMLKAICSGKHADGTPRMRYDGKPAGPSFVVMTSQCLHGRVNMKVYSTGRDLLESGVICGEDMLPEVAYIKLMWALGKSREPAEVARIMATDVAGEMGERSPIDEFVAGHP